MYRVGIGHKVKSVKVADNKVQNFYSGDILPKNYEPHKSYIEQGIVIKIKKGAK